MLQLVFSAILLVISGVHAESHTVHFVNKWAAFLVKLSYYLLTTMIKLRFRNGTIFFFILPYYRWRYFHPAYANRRFWGHLNRGRCYYQWPSSVSDLVSTDLPWITLSSIFLPDLISLGFYKLVHPFSRSLLFFCPRANRLSQGACGINGEGCPIAEITLQNPVGTPVNSSSVTICPWAHF